MFIHQIFKRQNDCIFFYYTSIPHIDSNSPLLFLHWNLLHILIPVDCVYLFIYKMEILLGNDLFQKGPPIDSNLPFNLILIRFSIIDNFVTEMLRTCFRIKLIFISLYTFFIYRYWIRSAQPSKVCFFLYNLNHFKKCFRFKIGHSF